MLVGLQSEGRRGSISLQRHRFTTALVVLSRLIHNKIAMLSAVPGPYIQNFTVLTQNQKHYKTVKGGHYHESFSDRSITSGLDAWTLSLMA